MKFDVSIWYKIIKLLNRIPTFHPTNYTSIKHLKFNNSYLTWILTNIFTITILSCFIILSYFHIDVIMHLCSRFKWLKHTFQACLSNACHCHLQLFHCMIWNSKTWLSRGLRLDFQSCSTLHTVEISEFYCHGFFAKISSK